MRAFFDQWPIWINPLWIALGSALGLQALWKSLSWGAITVYLFLTAVLVMGAARSSLRQAQRRKAQSQMQARIESGREALERQQRTQLRRFTEQQEILLKAEERLNHQQTKIGDQISELSALAKQAYAQASLGARILDVTAPMLQIWNPSTVEARHIFWQLVVWDLDRPGMEPLSIPSQTAMYMKPKTMPLPNALNIHVPSGQRIFGFLAVDCANCGFERYYWVFFRFAQSGWFAPLPQGKVPVLSLLTKHLADFRNQRDDKWLDAFAEPDIRKAIKKR